MPLSSHSLVKHYGAHVALDGASFSVPPETGCLVLIGASGSGKSTLLRVLGSLLKPDSGEVTVDGHQLQWDERSALKQRRRNGFVFQGYNLFPHFTALENVCIPLREVHGFPEEKAHTRGKEVLHRFGLSTHMEKRPAELSGGQQQRVALARAIAPEPALLLLDEPTSALDPVMTQDVLDLIRQLAEGGQRIILSTHEISFARRVADWVLFMEHGRIVESAPARTFFDAPTHDTARAFLDTLTRYR